MVRHLLIFTLALAPTVAFGQTTQPAAADAPAAAAAAPLPADYELRTMQAFANSEWRKSLTMLKKLEASLADKPDKLKQIQEYIRVAERNIADPKAAAAFDPKSMLVNPNDPPTDPDKRKKHVAPTGDAVLPLTIKELGNFQYDADKGGNVPADVKALNGVKVRLSGYMIPLDQASRITNFALVPDLLSCCFGAPPSLQHMVVVHVPQDKGLNYYPDEIVCEGTLVVEEKKDDEFIVSLFELNVTSVKPAVR
ncbi:MAG TPA: DUF3299 domain-containing protein [Tepidisphaeraceae bacterium]|jgi:hypothetical protein|nr:DUF3299 domain-containing protein [Tepidisphaeraceae bacterium]